MRLKKLLLAVSLFVVAGTAVAAVDTNEQTIATTVAPEADAYLNGNELDRDELEELLRKSFKPDAKENEPAEMKAIRHAWLKHVPSGEVFAEIKSEVEAVNAKLQQLSKLMDEHQRTGSLVTTEFFGSKPKWIMSDTSFGTLETSHPFYSAKYLSHSVWAEKVERGQSFGRRIKNIFLTHKGYQTKTISFNNILPVLPAEEDDLNQLKNLFRQVGVPEAELETAIEILVSQYLDYIELAKTQIYDPQVALLDNSLIGGLVISNYDPAILYIGDHINSKEQLFDFDAIAKMIDQNQEARDALSIKVSQSKYYLEWQPERYIGSRFGTLDISLSRSLFQVGDGLTEELQASLAVEFKMLLDSLVSQGVAVKLTDEDNYEVYADADAVDGIPGRILFNVENGKGIWENRSYSMFKQYQELTMEKHNAKLRQLFGRYMEQVRSDIADMYLAAQQQEDNQGTPF